MCQSLNCKAFELLCNDLKYSKLIYDSWDEVPKDVQDLYLARVEGK